METKVIAKINGVDIIVLEPKKKVKTFTGLEQVGKLSVYDEVVLGKKEVRESCKNCYRRDLCESENLDKWLDGEITDEEYDELDEDITRCDGYIPAGRTVFDDVFGTNVSY